MQTACDETNKYYSCPKCMCASVCTVCARAHVINSMFCYSVNLRFICFDVKYFLEFFKSFLGVCL